MTETQMRIKAYKDALPGLRERVAAVALLLAMSFAMMTSASFAWLTISRSPELTGVSTTVAANGSLEIALVGPNGAIPNESAVGDSSATSGQSVTAANLTWGNMVNLSDESYGLENLSLRPAQLNTSALLDSPLYGAVYGTDGRIEELSSDFGYAIWDVAEQGFKVSDSYGVRAISSTVVTTSGAFGSAYVTYQSNAKRANLAAASKYAAMKDNSEYMNSLASMMGQYMEANIMGTDPTVDRKDIQNLRNMYAEFLECYDLELQAMAELATFQKFLKEGTKENDYIVAPVTAADIYALSDSNMSKNRALDTANGGYKLVGYPWISNLDQFKTDRQTIADDLATLDTILESGETSWTGTGLDQIVGHLVNVGQCTIGANNTKISSIGVSNAMSYLSGTQEARITNGILLRYEQRTGGYIEVQGLKISLPSMSWVKVTANIKTTADRSYTLFGNDLVLSDTLASQETGAVAMAEDTYGLAIDLWVRTNGAASYLTLEGNVLLGEARLESVYGTDIYGNKTKLYTVSLPDDNPNNPVGMLTVDLYQTTSTSTDESGNTTEEIIWRRADTHAIMTEAELGDAEPIEKKQEIRDVIGYEGENRVWGDNSTLTVDSTTQGSGSCYVYYADTPEDQARSLKLLEAFNVAFVDASGRLIGKAIMDTERYYADSGRVTVPLVLDPGSSILIGDDYQGNTIYALTALEQNVATRITAIVYLDGTKLSNKEVLAASEIQGKLNIQFGSTEVLEPISNRELEDAERKVTATVDVTEFDYDTAEGPMVSNVTVRVEGEQPQRITGFFIRKISSTQGSREDQVVEFESDGNGNWVGAFTFDSPGTYILRSVQLDGVDYDLPRVVDSATGQESVSLPTVVIKGFAISYLNCQGATDNYINVMSAAGSYTVDVSMGFVTDDPEKMPDKVVGRFIQEDGSAVNIPFTYNSTTRAWTGSAMFQTSGDYVLDYLVLDGNYVELPESMQYEAHLVLGMRVKVETTSPVQFTYKPGSEDYTEDMEFLQMLVTIEDNAGNEMPALDNVWLTYNRRGSRTVVMQTELTWNGSYYVGALVTEEGGPGIWEFMRVEVGNDELSYATESPVFTIMSPEPPSYVGHTTTSYQLNPGGTTGNMNVQIAAIGAGTVQALAYRNGNVNDTMVFSENQTLRVVKENADGEEEYVTVYFQVPGDAQWTIKELWIANVFDAEGNEYTEAEPMVINVSNTANTAKIVNTLNVKFVGNAGETQAQIFGKTDDNITGTFLESHEVTGLHVTITDYAGEAVKNVATSEGVTISGVTDVKLQYTYGNNSGDYGGYTFDTNASETLTNKLNNITVSLTDDGSGTNFVQTQTLTLDHAGTYKPKLTITINGNTTLTYTADSTDQRWKLPSGAPEFTVWSKKPSAKITNISPKGEHYSKWGYTASTNWLGITSYTFKYQTVTSYISTDQYSATLYATARIDNNVNKWARYSESALPKLTITAYDIGNCQSATLTLPKGDTGADVEFVFTSSTGVEQTLGSVSTTWVGAHKCDYYIGHGTQEITEMILVQFDAEYTVVLDHKLTITNPTLNQAYN